MSDQMLAAKRSVADDPFGALADDVEFYGPAPIGPLTGRDAVECRVVDPLSASFASMRWDPYLLLGGRWSGEMWVASTGELRGDMVAAWCGVPPVGEPARLRYGLFHRFEERRGRLVAVEIRMLVDLLALASDAGFELLPAFEGRRGLPPGPSDGPALLIDDPDLDVDPDATAATLGLVEDMLGGCNRLVDGALQSMGMHAYWHADMRWYGPHGVGATHGFDEFQRAAQGPSVASFPNRRGGFHRARIADGLTAAFTGWPSLRGTFDGVAFRGIEPTGREIGQNIMDFYVRRDDLLHENWVLIDLVDFASQCGVDLLASLPASTSPAVDDRPRTGASSP